MLNLAWYRWLKKSFPSDSQNGSRRRQMLSFRPGLETFEDRLVPATITVTSNADSGAGTLRTDLLLTAGISGETIDFAANIRDIVLTSGGLTISSNVSIVNDQGSGPVTINGSNKYTVFTVDSGVTASVSGLTISGGDGTYGGGINNSGTLMVSNSTFDNNSSGYGGGGGIYNSGSLTVNNSTFNNNTATAVGVGGGINNGGILTVSNSTFDNNSATENGGGGISNGDTLTLSNSTFNNNSGQYGGGVCNSETLTISNCTFDDNSATDSSASGGGGIANGGNLTVNYTTIFDNNATKGSGGIANDSSATLNGDIVVGNTSGSSTPDDIDGTTSLSSSSSHNLVGLDNTHSLTNGNQGNQVGVTVAQAGLEPLGWYGGPTETNALLPGSDAIGKGSMGGLTSTDQRGFARPNGTQGDVGAFQTTSLIVNTTVDSNAVAAGQLSLRDAVNIVDVDTTGTSQGIAFDPNVFASPQTIVLGGGLTLGGSSAVAPISISGPGSGVTIDGNNTYTVFTVGSGVSATLSGLTIADAYGAGGGAIFNQGDALTVSDCTLDNNYAEGGGGGIYNAGSLTVSNSTFDNNSAGYDGGGIFNELTLMVSDSTFVDNYAQNAYGGGGIYNNLEMEGGKTLGNATLNGDILVGNTSGSSISDDMGGDSVVSSSSYNLVGVDNTGTLKSTGNNQVGDTVAQADLGPLANNGGPTETNALLPGSLALGKGLTANTAGYDQRGVARPIGQPGDVGAFQFSAPPSITTEPSSATVNVIQNVSFSAAATDIYTDGSTSVLTTVQWAMSTDGGRTFTPITGGGIYGSSATSDALTINSATPTMNGYEYEAIFTNPLGQTATTTVATLTVDFAPTIATNPSNVTVNAGATTSFTASASGNPAPSVQWYVNQGNGFTPLSNIGVYSGSSTDTLTITGATAAMNGYEYEAFFKNNGNQIANTSAALLTVDTAPTVTSDPSNAIVSAGSTTTFTASASGNPAPAVQWEISSDGGLSFTALAPGGVYGNSVTTNTLTITGVAAAMNGYEYEAVFSNNIGPVVATSPAKVILGTAPTLVSNPSSVIVNVGGTTTFSASASAYPAPTVKWYVNEGTGFAALSDGGVYSGSSTDTLTITGVTAAMSGNEYEAIFTNVLGTATTSSATLTDMGMVISEGANVLVYSTGGKLIDDFAPFGSQVKSVQVALGNVMNAGYADLVVASGSGGGQIRIYNGVTENAVETITPYGASYTKGLNIALGNVLDSNGADMDIVVAPGGSGEPVKIYNSSGTLKTSFVPYASAFPNESYTGGLHLAVGNLNGTGQDEIAVGTANPQVAEVETWNYQKTKVVQTGKTYSFAGKGVYVATAIFTAGSPADLIVGTETVSGTTHSQLYVIDTETTKTVASLSTSSQPVFGNGGSEEVRVGVGDINGDGIPDIVVATGAGTTQEVQVYDLNGNTLGLVEALTASELDLPTGYNGGIFVG
jgi:hypothetical protein